MLLTKTFSDDDEILLFFVNKDTSKAFEACSSPVMEKNGFQECKVS